MAYNLGSKCTKKYYNRTLNVQIIVKKSWWTLCRCALVFTIANC